MRDLQGRRVGSLPGESRDLVESSLMISSVRLPCGLQAINKQESWGSNQRSASLKTALGLENN